MLAVNWNLSGHKFKILVIFTLKLSLFLLKSKVFVLLISNAPKTISGKRNYCFCFFLSTCALIQRIKLVCAQINS